MEVQLGAVERAVALVDDKVLAHVGDGLFQGFRGDPRSSPRRCGLPAWWTARSVGQAKHGVHLVEQADHVLDFVLHLIPSHKDVGIVLGEAADTEQAVERTGQLMTMHQTQFAQPQGQVTIGVRLGGCRPAYRPDSSWA